MSATTLDLYSFPDQFLWDQVSGIEDYGGLHDAPAKGVQQVYHWPAMVALTPIDSAALGARERDGYRLARRRRLGHD